MALKNKIELRSTSNLSFPSGKPLSLDRLRLFHNDLVDSTVDPYAISTTGGDTDREISLHGTVTMECSVHNPSPTETIQKNNVLTTVGGTAGVLYVEPAVASNHQNRKYKVKGVSLSDIPPLGYGRMTYTGVHKNIDLSMFELNQEVFLSQTTPGHLIPYSELSPYGRFSKVGRVLRNTVDGILLLDIFNEALFSNNTSGELSLLSANANSTGVHSFTGITRLSDTTFEIGPVHGWIVDNETAPELPTVTHVEFPGLSNLTTSYLNTSYLTYFLLNSSGSIVSQSYFPTPEQRRTEIYLGKIAHVDKTKINTVLQSTDHVLSPMATLRDMFSAIPLINSGIYLAPTTGLGMQLKGGYLYGLGINFPNNNRDPNRIQVQDSVGNVSFEYRTQNGNTPGAGAVSLVDPLHWDNMGTVTLIGAPAKQATNQRIFLLENGTIRIQYGQTVYGDLEMALAGLPSEPFKVFDPYLQDAILLGVLTLSSDAVNLQDSTKAVLKMASKIGEIGGGGGTGLIQNVYGTSGLGGTYSDLNLTDTFNAYTINYINDRVISLENGSATTISTVGSGNAITSLTKNGTIITASRGETFATTSSNSFTGNQTITGSLVVTNGITGSLLGTASNADLLDGKDSTVFATTGSNTFKANQIITGSLVVTAGITGSLLGTVSNADLLDGKDSTTFATTGSNIFIGNQTITGSLTTTTKITTPEFNTNNGWLISGSGNELHIISGSTVKGVFHSGGFYSTGEVSAYGLGAGGGGGTGLIQNVYGTSGLGGTYSDLNLTDTFNAYTINYINDRVISLENGSATTISTVGSGNAITSLTKNGTIITASRGETFATTSSNSFTGNQTITGSLIVTAGITGSLLGTASNADLLDGKDSTIFATTGSNSFKANQTITGSLIVTNGITGSLLGTASNADLLDGKDSTVFATTGSNTFKASQTITGSLVVTNGITGSLLGTASNAINAITASNAIKLTTARLINSESFDGTADINIPRIYAYDDRIIAPADHNTKHFTFGFTTFNNDNNSPYADYIHMRGWIDGSGGKDNLLTFKKDGFGIRLWQQTWGSSSAYSSYKDIAFTDSNITGTASYASNADLLDGKDSTTFATTGSNLFKADQTITGSLIATTKITAPKLDTNNGWFLSGSGSELHIMSGSTIKGVFHNGGFYSTGEVSAYGSGTGGLANLTVNYVPKNTAGGLADSLIYSSGSGVGIGTTTIGRRLNIIEGGSADYQMRIGATNTLYYDIGRSTSTGYLTFYGVQSGYDGYSFTGVGGEKMRINADGKVGLGVIPSTYQLELSTDDAAKLSSTTWDVTSDERLKENIQPADLDRCYEIVKTVPLKRYTWKNTVYTDEQISDRSKLGWIANEVQNVFPKAVKTHPQKLLTTHTELDEEGNEIQVNDVIEDCLSMNADQIYAVMYGTIQKLQQKVEELENKLNLLTQ